MLNLVGASSWYTEQASRSDLTNVVLPKVKIAKKTIFNTKYSQRPTEEIYCMTSKSGSKIKYYSDTCKKEGEVECLICPRRFDIRDNTGIIVSLEIDGDKVLAKTTLVTCSHNCSLRYLIEESKKGKSMSSAYTNSIYYHNLAYSIQYPDKGPLVASGDPCLLQIHGGSMTYEEWCVNSSSLCRTSIMTVVPVKSSYVKQ